MLKGTGLTEDDAGLKGVANPLRIGVIVEWDCKSRLGVSCLKGEFPPTFVLICEEGGRSDKAFDMRAGRMVDAET